MNNILPAQILTAIAANWWVLLLRGVLLVILGLYALTHPGLTLIAWALMVGVFLLVDGVLAIVAGLAGWAESRGMALLRGVLALLIGGVAVAQPALFGGIAGITLMILLAAYSIVGGLLEIIVAVRERKAIQGEGWMILSGMFSVLFGVVLLAAPLFALGLAIVLTGACAIVFGGIAIVAALKLRRLRAAK